MLPPERPRHQGEAESSFDPAPCKVIVFQTDGNVVDLTKLLLVTEFYLEKSAIKCLVEEVSSTLSSLDIL